MKWKHINFPLIYDQSQTVLINCYRKLQHFCQKKVKSMKLINNDQHKNEVFNALCFTIGYPQLDFHDLYISSPKMTQYRRKLT